MHTQSAPRATLLALGGPEPVLQEAELAHSDHTKALYLGSLLQTALLNPAQTDHALAFATNISSDYELRRALQQAMNTQSLDAARLALLLTTGKQIDSDYELSPLLQEAAAFMPADALARAAWLAAAGQLDSDYELGQAIEKGLMPSSADAVFATALITLAAERMESGYELRRVLSAVAVRDPDPTLASAHLDAVSPIDSDHERRLALERIAPRVAADAELIRRYRELARSMGDYDRGQALTALDDATRD